MNIQEAYRQLDLANGLDFDRVQSQYTTLKSGLAEKISGTSNAVLKEVYQKRLDEVEEAYTILAEHFNHDVNDDVSSEDNGSSFTEDRYTISDTEVKASRKLNIKLIAIIGSGIVVLTALFFAFFGFQPKLDPKRTLEGEEQIFVSSLRLRKTPEIKKDNIINSYPTGTRFIYDTNEVAKVIDKMVWRKIHICDTVNGWGTEEKPFLYSGWIATSECGIQYVADPDKTQQLLKIFEKDEKHFIITSSFRHALVDYFVENDYLSKWYVPDGNYDSTYKPVVKLNNLSDNHCSKKDPKDSPGVDLFVVIRSFEDVDQKILLMTVDSNGKAMVKDVFDFPGKNFYLKVDGEKNKVLLGGSYSRVGSWKSEIYFDTYRNKYRL